jgi:hypothetical protein
MANGRLEKPIYALPEQLTLLGIEDAVAEHEHLSVDEMRGRSEKALAALSALKVKEVDTYTGEVTQREPRWMELYRRLRDGGWHWRVATYIAWAAQPKKYRWPDTQDELARSCLGLTSDRVIATWRKRNPAIDEYITMLQSSIIFDDLPDAYHAMVKVASQEDYKGNQDRKLMFEMAGVYTPSSRLTAEMIKKLAKGSNVDATDLSDEELREIVAAAGNELEQRTHTAEAEGKE